MADRDRRLSRDDLTRALPKRADLARVRLKPDRGRGAAKVKLYRRRQRLGLAVLRIIVKQADVVRFLIESGRLTDTEALDRRRVEQACAEALADLAARWLLTNCNR